MFMHKKTLTKTRANLKTIGIILLIVLSATLQAVPSAYADTDNIVQNPGFESSTVWEAHYSSFLGSYAKVQDSTYKHSGSYSGLTKTTAPKQEYCAASLYQDLNVPVQNLSTFYYWIRKGNSAPSGYLDGKLCIHLTGGYKLHYYHGFARGSSPPPDGAKCKYINVGDPKQNLWIRISRNLFTDLIDKFGGSIFNQNISGIELFSFGEKDLQTHEQYGQIVNWDDIFMESEPVSFNISLTSITVDRQANVGSITIDDTEYTLPNSTENYAGFHSAIASPPEGYNFGHWQTIGGISVANNTSGNTTMTIVGSGTLTAFFTKRLWTVMIYLGCDNDIDAPPRPGVTGPWSLYHLNKMEMVGSTNEVAVCAMADSVRTSQYRENHYYIKKDNDTTDVSSPIKWYDLEVNTGHPNTLVEFINRSVQWYPAERYALIVFNHGQGFRGIIKDDWPEERYNQTDPDWLEMSELREALNKTKNDLGITLDVIGFHACVMAQVEVAYQIREFTEVFVASEELQYMSSWPYDWILGDLVACPLMEAEELGRQIITCIKDYNEAYLSNKTDFNCTHSAITMSKIDGVAKSINDVGNWLEENLETYKNDIDWVRDKVREYGEKYNVDYVDAYHVTQLLSQRINDSTLQDLCQLVQQNVTSAIVSNWTEIDDDPSCGLSLFFPNMKSEYVDFQNEYEVLCMSQDYNGWDEFLKEYLDVEE
jgi:hypothetical protein